MIGIIGGTGIYDPKLLTNSSQRKVHTPFGSPSDLITLGKYEGKEIAIIPRHGLNHQFNPSNVNYRANIWALKELGVKFILAPSAVGSLQENIKPGEFVFADQFIDRTTNRKQTFFEGSQVCHISTAHPICEDLRKTLINSAKKLNLKFHEKGTYVCIEGPRFSTKAESNLFRSWSAQIIGMTLVPEAVLAREAEICYANISMVTDFDSFAEKPVTVEEIIQIMKNNSEKVKQLITEIIPRIHSSKERKCECKDALKNALI